MQEQPLGVESAVPDMLKSMGKSLSSAAAEQALHRYRQAGIEPEIGFLMFLPDNTPDDIGRNFVFLRKTTSSTALTAP